MRLVSRCENKHTSYSRGSRNQQHFPRFSTNSRWLPLARRSHDVPMLWEDPSTFYVLFYTSWPMGWFSFASFWVKQNLLHRQEQGAITKFRRNRDNLLWWDANEYLWLLEKQTTHNTIRWKTNKRNKAFKRMSFDQHNVIKVILVLTGPTWVQLYYNWTQVGPVVGLALIRFAWNQVNLVHQKWVNTVHHKMG